MKESGQSGKFYVCMNEKQKWVESERDSNHQILGEQQQQQKIVLHTNLL